MRTKSAKAKARRLQDWVVQKLITILDLTPEQTVKPAIMGEKGVDVQLATSVSSIFPYSIECKNVERLNIWDAWEQTTANCLKSSLSNTHPLLIISKNRKTPLAIVDAEHFIRLHKNGRNNIQSMHTF